MAQNIQINFKINGQFTANELNKVNKSLTQLGAQSVNIKKVNDSIKSAGMASATAASGVKRLAGTLGSLIAVYAGFSAVANATRNLIEFNKAVSEVQTIAKLGREPLGALKESLLDISTATGKSAAEATRTFYQIQSAGITDVVQAQRVLEASLKLSVGSLANAETTTLALTKAMAVYGDTIKGDPTKAADILFRGVELGQTRMEDLAMAIPQVLGPAKNLGISFEDLVGAVASFSKRAGSTSIAVTQLQSIFSALARKQSEASKVLGENADFFSLQSLRAKGLTKFLKELTDAVGANGEQLFKLFGRKEAVVGTLSAYADGFEDLGKTINEAGKNAGASEAAFSRIVESIDGQVSKLRETATNIILRFGIQGEDAIVSALKSLNEGLKSIDENVEALFIKIKALVITVGIVAFTRFSIKAVTALKAIQLQFIAFRQSAAVNLTGAKVSLKSFVISLKAATVAVKLFKATATLGLSIVLDLIIEKLLTLESELGGWGKVWDAFANQGKIVLKSVQLAFQKFALKFNELRLQVFGAIEKQVNKVREKLGQPIQTSGFETVRHSIEQNKIEIQDTIAELNTLEGKLQSIQDKQFGTGELLKRPEPFNVKDLFALPGDIETPTIPGVPEPAKVNEKLGQVRNAVLAFNAEMNQIRAEQKALEDEEIIQIRIAQGEATAADFERLRNIELEKINIKFQAEIEKTKLIQDEEKRRQELAKLNAKKELALDKTRSKQSINLAKQTQAIKLQSEQKNVQLIAGVGQLGAALAKDGSKAQFLIQKASAIAGSIVATQLAAAQALAQPPGPPVTVPLAAKVKAIGALNVATIAATAIKGFRTGGIVPGSPTGGRDSVLAQVEPREGIFTRAQQSRLFQLANGAEPESGGKTAEMMGALINAISSQPINVEIDGRELMSVIRNQRLAGVTI